MRRRRRPSIPLLSLFLIYRSSLSPCLVIALSLTFYSPHSLLRLTWITLLIKLTLDFRRSLPSWESDVLLLIVCHFLDFYPFIIPIPSIHFFLPQAHKINSMQLMCKHAQMHFPVYCQPSHLSRLHSDLWYRGVIEALGVLQVRHSSRQGGVTFPWLANVQCITFKAAHTDVMCLLT